MVRCLYVVVHHLSTITGTNTLFLCCTGLNDLILEPLRKLFFSSSVPFKVNIDILLNQPVGTLNKREHFKRSRDDITLLICQTSWIRFNVDQWWQVLWILSSFKKLEKVMYTVHSNTIYPWFLSKTKPKLFILHSHRSRYLRSLYQNWIDLTLSINLILTQGHFTYTVEGWR